MQLNFRIYLEALADFGFDRKINDAEESKRPEQENPINTFDVEGMCHLLHERTLGNLLPSSRFINEVQWGSAPGAIRLWVDPKTGIYMERLGIDLKGDPRWYVKKYFQVNRHGYGGYEEVVSQEIFDHVEKIYHMPLDSPKSDYTNLKTLVIEMAERLKKEARPIFLFDRIVKMNEDRYMIWFHLRGQGVQAPGQLRIEKNVTDCVYYPTEGYVRVMNYNYTSPLGQHKWEVAGPDVDVCYFPTQSRDEMIGPIATNMRFY